MQAKSAISEELCDIQHCTSVGNRGTTTGDQRTRTMATNPTILRISQQKIAQNI